MQYLNVEIKAIANHPEIIRNQLSQYKARFLGIDFQKDIYFNVPNGFLKLRMGNIENALIFYSRQDVAGPRRSEVILQPVSADQHLLEMLSQSLGIRAEIKKERELYLADQVKIHLDHVEGLGNFVEIEAIHKSGVADEKMLVHQCEYFIEAFGLRPEDMLARSYCDLLLERQE